MIRTITSAVTIACALTATSAFATTYDMNVILDGGGFSTNGMDNISINDAGQATYQTTYPGFPPPTAMQTATYNKTTQSWDFENSFAGSTAFFLYPIRNDAGQILVQTVDDGLSPTHAQMAILNPDGTKRVLAEQSLYNLPANPGVPTYKSVQTSNMAINENGDVAAVVTTLDDKNQIVKFPGDGSAPVVIVENDPNGIFSANYNRIDINDAGQVAFIGTVYGSTTPNQTITTSVYVSDGTSAPQAVVTGTDFQLLGPVAINNSGQVMVATIETNATQAGYVVQTIGDPPAAHTIVGAYDTNGHLVQSVNLNDYGQVAYKYGNGVYLDGQLVLSPGDSVAGLPGTVLEGVAPGNSIDLRPNFGFNDLGEALVGLDMATGPGTSSPALVRIDPEGATSKNPLVPFTSTVDGQNSIALNIINGLGLEAPIFVDPPVPTATGFTYSLDPGAPNFASLVIPRPLSGGQGTFDVLFNGMMKVLGIGETLNFGDFVTGGVSSFTISGIDPKENVAANEPFVVGLTFVSGSFRSTLKVNAITGSPNPNQGTVPLPAGLPLLLTAMGGLAVLRRRRRV